MKKIHEIRKKRSATFSVLKSIVKIFKKKPEIIILDENALEDRAIYIANHSAASGPFTFELFFPKYFIPWGTYEMCGNYKMRWNYLYHVFYQQKLHYSKFKSFILATGFALISRLIYNATGLIATYRDVRLKNTFEKSTSVLNKSIPLLIFPEDSSEGYADKPNKYFKGFITLSKIYFKKTNIDVPIYNVYYNKEKNKIIIDKPIKINALLADGKTEDEIAEMFLKKSHEIFEKYINHTETD